MSQEPQYSESLSLEEAAKMRQESEQSLKQAHMMKNIRDLDAAAAMAFLIITIALAMNHVMAVVSHCRALRVLWWWLRQPVPCHVQIPAQIMP